MQKQTILRYLFWSLWFLLIPGTVAVAMVSWCQTDTDALGGLGMWVREQSVPAGIIFFTLAEATLYYFRHSLPYGTMGGAPPDLPKDLRREYEAANQLLDEARRLLRRHEKAVERAVSKESRDRLNRSLERLDQTLHAKEFDGVAFRRAFDRASDQVDQHLAPWRKSELREYVESIGVAILIALSLRAVVVEAFKIPSGSMLPTLQIDDHIFVNKFDYGPTIPFTQTRLFDDLPPERGDVIVFEFPDPEPGQEVQDFIKRVIALPGDTLEVEDGHPIINGWRVPSCKVGKYRYGARDGNQADRGDLFVEFLGQTAYLAVYEEGSHTLREGPFRVGPGEVWVMGDNRHNSHDSRKWRGGRGGGVPFQNIQGRAMFVWFPLDRLFVPVMGKPQVPKGMDPALTQGIEACLAKRPAVTLPPAPSR